MTRPARTGDARHALIDSPVGALTISAAGDALTGIYFEGHRHPPRPDKLGRRLDDDPDNVDNPNDPLVERVREQFTEYFAGSRTVFDLPLAPLGEPFQLRVWQRLRQIPFGERTTYGTIATEFGDPRLARAVGAAVGRNPISIVIPCHRVVASTGALTGFAGGLNTKAKLLALEANDVLF